MTPELQELYRYTIAEQNREIAELKARIFALEQELQRSPGLEKPLTDRTIFSSPITVTITG